MTGGPSGVVCLWAASDDPGERTAAPGVPCRRTRVLASPTRSADDGRRDARRPVGDARWIEAGLTTVICGPGRPVPDAGGTVRDSTRLGLLALAAAAVLGVL